MQRVSEGRILSIAEQYNVNLDEHEVGEIRSRVEENLRSVTEVETIPTESAEAAVSDRWWCQVAPHSRYENNEVITECRIASSTDGLLSDITLGVKDNIAVGGIPMTGASAILNGYIPPYDAPVIERLLAAGATITAKTNLDEFGNAGLGSNAWGGNITNPSDPTRTAGGSSGGSAAAVANNEVDAAIGTDTGGSVRIPAAYCGVIGLKPSYGLIPMSGVLENTAIQDHLGFVAKSVETTGRLLDAAAGTDPKDPGSLRAAGREGYEIGGYLDAVASSSNLYEITIGVIAESLSDVRNPAVRDRTQAAIDRLQDNGITVKERSIPHYDLGIPIKNGLSYPANAAFWRSGGLPYRQGGGVHPYGDVREELTYRSRTASGHLNQDLKAKIITGGVMIEDFQGQHYAKARAGKERLKEEFEEALAGVDALVTPTMPDIAPPLDNCPPSYDYGRNVRHANITQLPAVTLPNGTIEGLPIGLQLMGTRYDDGLLLAVADQMLPVLG